MCMSSLALSLSRSLSVCVCARYYNLCYITAINMRLIGIMIIFAIFSFPASSAPLDNHACLNQSCGNLTVKYPFKLTSHPECPSFSPFFDLDCHVSSGKLYLIDNATQIDTPTPLQVTEILNDSLIVDFSSWRAAVSINASDFPNCSESNFSTIQLPPFPGPYFISDDNKLASFDCTLAVLYTANLKRSSPQDYSDLDYSDYSDLEIGGCAVMYPDDQNNQNCGDRTCCIAPFTAGTSSRFAYFEVDISSYSNGTACNSSCSSRYSILFHPDHTDFHNEFYGLRLKWALPSNQTTPSISQTSDFACSANAKFTLVEGVPGYLCFCNPGYTGDGYSKGSDCTDANECEDPSLNNCILGSTCHNSEGNYTCQCSSWFYVGDGRINGSGCRFSARVRNALSISAGILGLALLLGGLFFLAIWWKKRIRRKYFMQNGGLQLQAYTTTRGRETARLFTVEELKVATNNYSDQMKLGMGRFGTVFKGTIEHGRVVAIKKANGGKDRDNEQFLNEMAILTQINHKHIVRLLGCCLETPMPQLVYEYVSNGNVAQNLDSNGVRVMGWEQRLKVARQIADALTYLHVVASPPILHQDVKSTNVLLDDNLDAKLADFGMSRLIVDSIGHVSTTMKGTTGYLDPEYLQTFQLTDKSDVYSFGIILVELITGLKPFDNKNREPCFANLATLFIDFMEEGRGEELIDSHLKNTSTLLPSDIEWRHTQVTSIMAVARLAHCCLTFLGIERPSMSQVADELRHITQSLQETHQKDDDENIPLLPFE